MATAIHLLQIYTKSAAVGEKKLLTQKQLPTALFCSTVLHLNTVTSSNLPQSNQWQAINLNPSYTYYLCQI